MKWILSAGCWIAVAMCTSSAFACHPQFNEIWTNFGTAQWSGDAQDCSLSTTISAAKPSAATTHFRRQQPGSPLRVSFRISPPAVTWTSIASFTAARGTSAAVPAKGPMQATVFKVVLLGNQPANGLRVGIFAACTSQPNGSCGTVVTTPATFPLRMTVEISVGEGEAGKLSFWFGDDTSGPPTAVLENLDNARWVGIERVILGIADPVDPLPSVLDGRAVIFDQVSVSEQALFWSDFDPDRGLPVASNMPSIPMSPGSSAGNTCGGTDDLPVLASGTTEAANLKDIYSFTVDTVNVRWISVQSAMPSMSVYLCENGVSTTSRCMGASRSGNTIIPATRPGNYQVVVADAWSGCGAYTLLIGGTLGL